MSKYPSEELIRQWWDSPQPRGLNAIENVARKAADWARSDQREVDARICQDEKVDAEATGESDDIAYNTACDHCSTAIRQGAKPE